MVLDIEPLPMALSELRDSEGIDSDVCSTMASVDISMRRTPSFGRTVEDPLPDDAAEAAIEPNIIMKNIALTIPQTNRPQMTANTHLMNSLVFILFCFVLTFLPTIYKVKQISQRVVYLHL